ncbi:MAG: hypothetical protein LW806_11755 [Planctomycetaceae bacterium]|nr:hypothetical protein [Planctomycetaceae bacterium]
MRIHATFALILRSAPSLALALFGADVAGAATTSIAAASPTMPLLEPPAENPAKTVHCRWAAMRPSDTPEPTTSAERRSEEAGRLVHSRLDVRFEDVPIGEALHAIANAIGVNLLVFGKIDPQDVRSGIDVDRRIDLSLDDVSGRAALEAVLGLASRHATWQIFAGSDGRGMVEVGLRKDLARESARDARAYDVTDLSIDPPDFSGSGAFHSRRSTEEVAAELVRMISTHCEPEAFRPLPTRSKHDTVAGPVTGGRDQNDDATLNLDPSRGPVRIEGQWASIQTKQTTIVVLAPDFVHRAIEGYESSPPPRIGPPAGEDLETKGSEAKGRDARGVDEKPAPSADPSPARPLAPRAPK